MIYIAWRNLIKERMRFLLSVFGIAFAILLLFSIKGISYGISDTVVKYAENQNAEIVLFQKGVENMQMTSSFFPADVIEKVRDMKGIEYIEGLYGFNYQYVDGSKKITSYLIGYEKLGGPWNIKDGSKNPKKGEIIVDFAFAKKGAYKIGDMIKILDSRFKIAGISRETNPMGGLFLFVNKEES